MELVIFFERYGTDVVDRRISNYTGPLPRKGDTVLLQNGIYREVERAVFDFYIDQVRIYTAGAK